jgi:hypothetical protein
MSVNFAKLGINALTTPRWFLRALEQTAQEKQRIKHEAKSMSMSLGISPDDITRRLENTIRQREYERGESFEAALAWAVFEWSKRWERSFETGLEP